MDNHKRFTLLMAYLTKVLLIAAVIFLTACDEKGHTKNTPITGAAVNSCLLVKSGWIRELIPGQNITAGYPVLQNVCGADMTIRGIKSLEAKTIEIHQHKHDGAMMRMEQRTELTIKANDMLVFSPGDLHLMIFNPTFKERYFSFTVMYQYNQQEKTISATLPIKKLSEQIDNHDAK